MCECSIGIIWDYDNSRMVTVEELKEHIEFLNEFRRPFPALKPYQMSDYCDWRKNTDLTRFKFCPHCGKKIDWKALKGGVSE